MTKEFSVCPCKSNSDPDRNAFTKFINLFGVVEVTSNGVVSFKAPPIVFHVKCIPNVAPCTIDYVSACSCRRSANVPPAKSHMLRILVPCDGGVIGCVAQQRHSATRRARGRQHLHG